MSKSPKAKAKATAATTSNRRLRPGELDGLVLAFMRKHRKALPLSVSDIAEGIGRSSGAVANCLVRLAKKKKVRQAKGKPRAYDLKAAKP